MIGIDSAHWSCTVCQLASIVTTGALAAEEVAVLAEVHDLVHHGGAVTAEVRVRVAA